MFRKYVRVIATHRVAQLVALSMKPEDAIDRCVMIVFRDINAVIARFHDKKDFFICMTKILLYIVIYHDMS